MSLPPSIPIHSEAEQIELLKKQLQWAEWKIRALEERLRLELIAKYGPKSEKLGHAQMQLLELEPGVSAAEVEAESEREPLPAASSSTAANRKNRKHPGRRELPANLQRVERVITCTPDQCICKGCGQDTVVIGYEQSEQLDVEPARYFVVVTRREKRACRSCTETGECGGTAGADHRQELDQRSGGDRHHRGQVQRSLCATNTLAAMPGELHGFLQFKRSLGYGYARAEFALREFDRFLSEYAAKKRRWQLDRAAVEWLSSKPARKPVSVSGDAAILRQFFAYLRRLPNRRIVEPLWPQLPTESSFVPNFLSEQDILKLLALCADLKRPLFRAKLYRALLLILYCTGLRFGEALRVRMRDVDTRSGVIFVETFKGRARWVPFHRSLCRELDGYLADRVKYAPSGPDTRLFVGVNQRVLPVETAGGTLRGLFTRAGLKPEKRRVGPRPYDIRHAFAVHRLSRWLEFLHFGARPNNKISLDICSGCLYGRREDLKQSGYALCREPLMASCPSVAAN